MNKIGKVWLAGGGPGDAGLLTVKTKKLMEQADVIVYDALISTEIMCTLPSEKEYIYVGKRAGNHAVPQEGINKILLEEAQKGKKVLRLKGGDPFVFGRGGEELELLVEHGIPFEIVPGITSPVAVAAYAGIPITHRDYTSSFHVITGHAKKGEKTNIDFESLVRLGGTLVFLMGISSMEAICEGLLEAGMDPSMPAAVLEKGTTSRQRRIVSDVSHLVETARNSQVQTPAIIVVGKVCRLEESFGWAEKRTLGGKQFLITRPKQNISVLAERLREEGAQVLEIPSIVTKPQRENETLRQAILNPAKKSRWLVFTSPIGVQYFFEQLVDLELDVRNLTPEGGVLKVAAIGKGTARELRRYGLRADLVPETFDAGHLGQAIAGTAEKESEILIARARMGSEELLPPLQAAGLIVKDIPIYDTVYEVHENLREQVYQAFLQEEIDGVTFTSASTVKGFVQGFPEVDFTKIQAVCIGRQTAAEAEKYKMNILIAKEASMDSMMELICQQFGAK